ncbi:MAG TPA: LamG domain-containing protein [Planctomycetota bacterium]|nr:LamG domain-containing protein [Planctomycetota bacterium]
MKRTAAVFLGSWLASSAAWAQGPAGYWKGDDAGATTAVDSSTLPRPGANPGTYMNGATTVSPLPGTPAAFTFGNTRCMSFDGVNDHVMIPSFGSFTTFTVAVWIRRTGATAARESIVSYKEGNGVNMGFVLCLNENGSSQFPRQFVQINGTWRHAEQAVAVPLNTWVHLAGVYDGTAIRLYRDGAEVASYLQTGVMTNTGSQNVVIGARASGDLHAFPGLVDDVRIYGRALSAAEILSLYQGNTDLPEAQNPVLSAVAGIQRADLSWTPSPDPAVDAYTVQRATSAGGPWTDVVSGPMQTSYTHQPVAPSPPDYYYRVLALGRGTGTSNVVGPLAILPPPPRTNDHDEGLMDGRCECGTVRAVASPSRVGVIAIVLGLAVLLRRR